MANIFSVIFDSIILTGVLVFVIGWISGECGARLSERTRGIIFLALLAVFMTAGLICKALPLPRVW